MINVSFTNGLPQRSVDKLASAVFTCREEGKVELLAWVKRFPTSAKNDLFNLARTSQNPEVRVRCTEVLKELVVDDYLKEGQ
jgi:hypothetical protein